MDAPGSVEPFTLEPFTLGPRPQPSSILLDASGKAAIADFGLSRLRATAQLVTKNPEAGTAPYMAPGKATLRSRSQ